MQIRQLDKHRGFKLKHFFWNFERKYKTWQSFCPSTKNCFSAFKFRVQDIFYLLEKTLLPPPGFWKFQLQNVFVYSTL